MRFTTVAVAIAAASLLTLDARQATTQQTNPTAQTPQTAAPRRTEAEARAAADRNRRNRELDRKKTGAPVELISNYMKANILPVPASLGLGFYLRGDHVAPSFLGTLTSARTFGGMGAGSTMFWVDPERALSCVFLSSGLITCELRNTDRMQRVSDMVVSALVD